MEGRKAKTFSLLSSFLIGFIVFIFVFLYLYITFRTKSLILWSFNVTRKKTYNSAAMMVRPLFAT